MQLFQDITTLRQGVEQWRKDANRIAFVPTMGNLHAGHLSLVQQAREQADKVIVSIYVNPTQFGENEDFDAYPRTLDEDLAALRAELVDGVFLPDESMIYPFGTRQSVTVEVPGLSDILCGEFRPGHFKGVSTVVCKLLNLVQPDVLFLGQKDYQQVAVIRRMLGDLFLPVEVMTGETVREVDGLAKSSRNQYLSLEERKIAPMLYETLRESVEKARKGESLSKVEGEARKKLEQYGFQCEYFEFRDADSLNLPAPGSTRLVLLAAAYLGKTRLIDNIVLTLRCSG